MTDIVDQETRSRMMSGIREKNTKAELTHRCALCARGFRFWLHASKVYGRPDLVLRKHYAGSLHDPNSKYVKFSIFC